MPARWQYEISAIEGHSSEVREHLAAMAEDGWELVNGSVTSAVHPGSGQRPQYRPAGLRAVLATTGRARGLNPGLTRPHTVS
jgi:hypothetical protein